MPTSIKFSANNAAAETNTDRKNEPAAYANVTGALPGSSRKSRNSTGIATTAPIRHPSSNPVTSW